MCKNVYQYLWHGDLSYLFNYCCFVCKILVLLYFYALPNNGFMKEPKHVARFGQQIIYWKYSCDWQSIYSSIHASQRDTSRWDESISLECGFSSGLLWTRNEVPAPVEGEKYRN